MSPNPRQLGATRGKRSVSFGALPKGPTWRARLARLPRGVWVVWGIMLGLLLALLVTWQVMTGPQRRELHRAQLALEALPELDEVHLSVPWFAFSMPESVEVTAFGLPPMAGQIAEIRVEMSGTYDPRTFTAHLKGRKQVLFPNTKLELDWERTVPPQGGG
ncbi:MAG: hypothetical protein NTW19_20525 [Planctomycetota bacterium]|nr:hypothetical protein [Planctomycetota bacterium]